MKKTYQLCITTPELTKAAVLSIRVEGYRVVIFENSCAAEGEQGGGPFEG